MRHLLVVFLGRNTIREDGTGILNEAREIFPGREAVIVAGNGDWLLTEAADLLQASGVTVIEVKNFVAEDGDYVLVANGGSTAQQVPVFGRLLRAQVELKVVDLQRDRVNVIWPES